jgi:hypothetical protein
MLTASHESAPRPQPIVSVHDGPSLAASISAAPPESGFATDGVSTPTANEEPTPAAIPPNAETSVGSNAKETKPSVVNRPVERRPAQAGSRQRNDWFSNQGKFIAIGFVLALIGTIYVARSNRGSGPATAIQPTVHPGEAGQQLAAGDSKAATVVGKNKNASPVDATADSAAETSPAELAEATTAEKPPATDLHPPTIPQLVREPANSSQPDNGALFPWSEQPVERLATRPIEPPATTSPPAQPQYPITPANAPLSQSYPVTSAANPSFAPGPQVPAPAAPDYRSPYIPAPPAGQPPMSGQSFAPSGGAASPYMPSDNTARGYRYERTGSGPY